MEETDAEKMKFEKASLHLQVGDIITSKLGILTKGSLSESYYLTFRMKYLGNNNWEQLGEKRKEIEVKELPNKQGGTR